MSRWRERGRRTTGWRSVRWASAAALGAVLALPGSSGAQDRQDQAADAEVLPRSIYVPVRFEVAPCLHGVVIRTEEGRIRAVAPGRIVSQFTFHDHLEGASPEFERLTIEGWVQQEVKPKPDAADPESMDADRQSRQRFRAGVVITPVSIYVAKKRLELDTMERISRFRRRVDLRVPERTLRLRPPTTCE